jgi:hypothetical protein
MLQLISWLAVITCFVLLFARANGAISFSEPLLAVTSGAEEDSLLAFWKHLMGMPVAEDPHKIPYSGSAYNWLYYVLYAEIIRGFLSLLSLDTVWLSTIGRFISLGFAAIGAAVLYVLLRRCGPNSNTVQSSAAVFSLFAFFGPLVGFWAISLHVEIAATVMSILSALVFCALYDDRPVQATIAACVFAYLAWSFKQSSIVATGALGLFLLLRQDWKNLSFAMLFHGAGWGAALILGSEAYVKLLLFKGTDKTLELWQFKRNIINLLVKTTPVLAAATSIPLMFAKIERPWRVILGNTYLLFGFCGLLTAMLITIPFSAKQGAAENYYFLLQFFIIFTSFACLNELEGRGIDLASWRAYTLFGWILSAIAVGSVLMGLNGVLSVRDRHLTHVNQRACIQGLPGPMLPIANPYLMLPWMSPHEPRFHLFYNYLRDRGAGRWFESGGVGILISRAYFGSIIMGAGVKPEFDGAAFTLYQRHKKDCAGLDIYIRRPTQQ